MLTFLLYCDLPTMNCNVEDINQKLSSFASSYIQVNDSLWFFKYPNEFDGSFLPKEEHLFYEYFDNFVNADSIIFINRLSERHYYVLPKEVARFLDED